MAPRGSGELGIIVDAFLIGQTQLPLSGGADLETARRLVESGVSIAAVANADIGPDLNPVLFNYAVDEVMRAHEEAAREAGITAEIANREDVARGIGGAARVNLAIAGRAMTSAANGTEFDDTVTKLDPADPRIVDAQEELDKPGGRARALYVMTAVIRQTKAGDESLAIPLDAAYRAAQLGKTSDLFPTRYPHGERRHRLREELMAHIAVRLGPLALSQDPRIREEPRIQATVKSFLQQESVDAASLRFGQGI